MTIFNFEAADNIDAQLILTYNSLEKNGPYRYCIAKDTDKLLSICGVYIQFLYIDFYIPYVWNFAKLKSTLDFRDVK